MILLSAVLLAFAAPRLDAAEIGVTYFTVAKPMNRVFAELSEKSGVKLGVSAELAQEPIIIYVHDASMKDLEDRLAQAMQAEWQEESGVLWLSRTAKKRRELEQAELQYVIKSIQAQLDIEKAYLAKHQEFGPEEAAKHVEKVLLALTPQADKPGDPQRDYMRMRQVHEGSPLYLLLRRLIACFDAKQLAQLPREERTVFSFQPTPLQRPFPPSAAKVLEQFRTEWEIWGKAAKEKNLGRFVDERNGAEINLKYLLLAGEKEQVPFSKALLSLNPNQFDLIGDAWLRLADSNGKIVIETYGSVASDVMQGGGSAAPAKTAAIGTPIQFSDRAKEWAQILYDFGSGDPDLRGQAKVSAELRKAMLHPEQEDPLSLAASEAVLSLAKAESKQIVACLTDDAGTAFDRLPNENPPTTARVRTILGFQSESEVLDSPGWLVVRPTRPLRCLMLRENRAALGTFLRSIEKEGRKTLDSESTYYASYQPSALENFTPGQMFQTILFPTPWNESRTNSRQALWLYGSMTAGQRAALAQGGTRFGALEPRQQSMLIRMMKWDRSYLVWEDAPFGIYQTGQWDAKPYWSIERDPTEALHQGISPSSPVTLTFSRQPGIRERMSGSNGQGWEQSLSGIDAAQTFISASNTNGRPGGAGVEWIEPRFVGCRTLSVLFGEGLRMDVKLSDWVTAGPRITDPSKASDEFRRLADETVKSAKRPPRQPPPPPNQ